MPSPSITPMGQVRLLGAPEPGQGMQGNSPANPDWRIQMAMMQIPKENQALAAQAMSSVFSTVPRVPFAAGWAAPQATMRKTKR